MTMQTDEAIRSAAFAAWSSIVNVCGQPLTWSEITQGFTVAGENILFANRARGIFKPVRLQRGFLSVKTREIGRRYATRETKQPLHQSAFREVVLDAYAKRCAFSGLPVRRLLQTAHIVPDSEAKGIASVRNGIALSTIHHAAFDAHLLGVNPDRVIAVSDRLSALHDGPMPAFRSMSRHLGQKWLGRTLAAPACFHA